MLPLILTALASVQRHGRGPTHSSVSASSGRRLLPSRSHPSPSGPPGDHRRSFSTATVILAPLPSAISPRVSVFYFSCPLLRRMTRQFGEWVCEDQATGGSHFLLRAKLGLSASFFTLHQSSNPACSLRFSFSFSLPRPLLFPRPRSLLGRAGMRLKPRLKTGRRSGSEAGEPLQRASQRWMSEVGEQKGEATQC
jgi:hypothetical protein